jgi:hypothetical protein
MDITQLYVTQRKLRQPEQVYAIVESIHNGDYIPPILLSETDDGTVQVDDGHHRVLAYWVAGRTELVKNEYILVLTNRLRPRFGRVIDLLWNIIAITQDI